MKEEIISKEELALLELYDLSFSLVPQLFRSKWIVWRELFPKDKKIEGDHLGYLKEAIRMIENFFFKEEDEPVLSRIGLIERLFAQQGPNL